MIPKYQFLYIIPNTLIHNAIMNYIISRDMECVDKWKCIGNEKRVFVRTSNLTSLTLRKRLPYTAAIFLFTRGHSGFTVVSGKYYVNFITKHLAKSATDFRDVKVVKKEIKLYVLHNIKVCCCGKLCRTWSDLLCMV